MPAAAQKITYEGVHRYSVDANRRVQMPFRWRSAKPIEFTLILWPQHDAGPCLRVLSPEEYQKLLAVIGAMPATEKSALMRHIGSHSARMTLDSAKRLGMPEEMVTATGIGDEVVFAGMIDFFELWSPKHYEAMEELQKPVVVSSLKKLA